MKRLSCSLETTQKDIRDKIIRIHFTPHFLQCSCASNTTKDRRTITATNNSLNVHMVYEYCIKIEYLTYYLMYSRADGSFSGKYGHITVNPTENQHPHLQICATLSSLFTRLNCTVNITSSCLTSIGNDTKEKMIQISALFVSPLMLLPTVS